MPDNEKKTLKIKTTVRQAADKIKNSESAEKALHTVNNLADKTKSTTKDLTEKIKSSETVEKLSNNETVSKAKSAVSDVAEKVVNSEAGGKAKELVDSVKSKNIKANRIIKIGAVALIIVVIIGLFSNLFSEEKKVENLYEKNVISSSYYFANRETTRNYKIVVKCVAKEKTKGANYYALRSECFWEEPVYFDDEDGNEKMKWEEKHSFDLVIIKYKNGSWEDIEHTTYYEHNDGYYKQALHNAKEHFKEFKKL